MSYGYTRELAEDIMCHDEEITPDQALAAAERAVEANRAEIVAEALDTIRRQADLIDEACPERYRGPVAEQTARIRDAVREIEGVRK